MQADFSFYFDTGGRRRCYIAPERFYESGTADVGQLAVQQLLPEWVCGIQSVLVCGGCDPAALDSFQAQITSEST